MSAEQAAAQAAVAAASTPQPQQGTPQQSAATPVAGGSADSLTCQWQNCGERCPSAEQLYVSLLTLFIANELSQPSTLDDTLVHAACPEGYSFSCEQC